MAWMDQYQATNDSPGSLDFIVTTEDVGVLYRGDRARKRGERVGMRMEGLVPQCNFPEVKQKHEASVSSQTTP